MKIMSNLLYCLSLLIVIIGLILMVRFPKRLGVTIFMTILIFSAIVCSIGRRLEIKSINEAVKSEQYYNPTGDLQSDISNTIKYK